MPLIVLNILKKYWLQLLVAFGGVVIILLAVRWWNIYKDDRLLRVDGKIDEAQKRKLDSIVEDFLPLANNNDGVISASFWVDVPILTHIAGLADDDYDDKVFDAITYLAGATDAEVAYVNNTCKRVYNKGLYVLMYSSPAVYNYSVSAEQLVQRIKNLQ